MKPWQRFLQRRKMIINKPFQYQVLTQAVVTSLVLVALNGLMYVLFIKEVEFFLNQRLGSSAEVVMELSQILQSRFVFYLMVTMVFAFSVIVIGSLTLSHRVAGPIYKVLETLEKFRNHQGKMDPVKFRQSDFFPELEKSLNQLLNETVVDSSSAVASAASEKNGKPDFQI